VQAGALEQSNADLEKFAYVASHDLQEPLRKMASFSDLVRQRYADRLDDRGREYLGFIADGARRMQALINDVLEVSRAGRPGRPLQEVDLGAALNTALGNLSDQIVETGAAIESDALPVVDGDRALLVALFQNLVSNSLKFRTEAAPLVAVRVAPFQTDAGGSWEICVSDNGIGIDPRHSERIFAMFQRLHRRERYPGTGIGLSLAERIVQYHGGRIWLDTTHAPGASICFTLPRRQSDDP
ncbi:MAG: sensor histidine kinase, partial [Acidimicrobiales bacterium]